MGKISKSKKTLALVMALVMVFTIVPFGAWGVIKASAESTDQQAAGFNPVTELLDGHEYIIASWDKTMMMCDKSDRALSEVTAKPFNPDTSTLKDVDAAGGLWTYHYDEETKISRFTRKSSFDNYDVYLDFHATTGTFKQVHTYSQNDCKLKVENTYENCFRISRTDAAGIKDCYLAYNGSNFKVHDANQDVAVRIYESALEVPDAINLPVTIRDFKRDGVLIDPLKGGYYAKALGFLENGSIQLTDSDQNGSVYAEFLKLCGPVEDGVRKGLTQNDLKNGKIQYNPYAVIYLAHLLRESMYFGGGRDWNEDWNSPWEIPLLDANTPLARALVYKFSVANRVNHTDDNGGLHHQLKYIENADGSKVSIERYLYGDKIQHLYSVLSTNEAAKKAVYDFLVACDSTYKDETTADNKLKDFRTTYELNTDDTDILKDYWYTVSHADNLTSNNITSLNPCYEPNVSIYRICWDWHALKQESDGWFRGWHKHDADQRETHTENGAGFMDVAYFLLNNYFADMGDYNTRVTDAAQELQLQRVIDDTGIHYVYDSSKLSDWGTEVTWDKVNDADHDNYDDVTGDRIPDQPATGYIRNASLEKASGFDGIRNFRPIEDKGFKNETHTVDGVNYTGNYGFTLEGKGKFVYNSADDLYFEFTGDDDVFLYINGRKTPVDLGGIHGAKTKRINLNALSTELGLENGKVYDFNFYYMERCPTGANLKIDTNIKIMPADLVPQKTAYKDIDCAVEDMIPSGAKVPNSTKVWYEFGATNEDLTGNKAKAEKIKFIDNKLDITISPVTVKFGENDTDEEIATFLAANEIGYYIEQKDSKGKWNIVGTEHQFTSAQQIRNVMEKGIDADQRIFVYGIPHTLNITDETEGVYSNHLLVAGITQIYDDNGSVVPGTRKERRNTDLTKIDIIPKTSDVTMVVDYAGTLKYDPAAMFSAEEASYVTKLTEVSKSASANTLAVENGKVVYTMKNMLESSDSYTVKATLTQPEYKVMNSAGTAEVPFEIETAAKTITFVPANNVYYDDSFEGITYDDNWTVQSKAGAALIGVGGTNEIYGNAGSEVNFSEEAHYVVGDGVNKKVTASFTFKGEGYTLYMDTNANSGNILVKTSKVGSTDKPLVDMLNITSENEYHGIPVVNRNKLSGYGEYKVEITVNIPESKVAALNGIRVYRPLETDDIHYVESEKNAQFFELRDNMVTYVAGETQFGNGVIYIDGAPGTANIANYEKQGPKNEIYLAHNQGIMFKLNQKLEGNQKVHAGARVLSGTGVVLGADKATPIANTVDMFYEINAVNADENLYMIKNTGTGVLAITNIKITNAPEIAFGTFSFDEATTSNLIAMFSAEIEVPEVPTEPEEPENPTEPTDPEVPETPTEPETPVVPQNPFEKFFNDIRDFFNKLFGIK